jgi:mannosylglycerate hydrolase
MDVAAEDGHAGLGVAAAGLHEFAVEEGTVSLTLLRAVGYLGAGRDITTLIGGAGPHIPTPEAPLQQTLRYEIALCPHVGRWDTAQVWREAQDFLTPPRSITEVPHTGTRPPIQRGIQISGDNAVCSSIKQSEDGQGLILRLFNPTAEATQAAISLPRPVAALSLADLQEETLAALDLSDSHTFTVDLPAKRIITLKAIFTPDSQDSPSPAP